MLLDTKIFNKKYIGDIGEDYAVKYLRKNKYKVIERNFSSKSGEIDIICKKNNVLTFVEVKSRSNYNYGSPVEAVDYFKQKKIISCAKYYIMKHKITDMYISFDVIEVFMSPNHKPIKVNHIKNAFGG